MTDQPQNSLTIEQILEIAGKVPTWTSYESSLTERCWGRYTPESSYAAFTVTITPRKYPFIRKVKSVDLEVEFHGSNSTSSPLAKYYHVDWPAAIKLYNNARDSAIKNNLKKIEESRQEGIKCAQSILGKK